MIDDYVEAMELVRKMEAQLPISARPTRAFIQAMHGNEVQFQSGQEFQIESVLYLGDEGGIGCAVRLPGQEGTAIIVSLTHIRVVAGHPLVKEIRSYQMERTRKLAQTNRGRRPTQFTVRPRGKRKRH